VKNEIQSMSNLEYHADKSHLSSSSLKLLLKDPAAFYTQYILGERNNEEKDVFSEGSFVHALILEPHTVEQGFAVYPGMRKSGTAWETFKQENPNKILLSTPQVLRCQKLAQKYAAMPIAVSLVSGGFAEHSLVGSVLDVKVKMRADYINIDKGYIADVKTTSMPGDLELFRQTCTSYAYDLSAALYCEIAYQNFGKLFDFYFIVLSKADGSCHVYKASSKSLSDGAAKVIQAVVLYKKCTASNVWSLESPKAIFDTKEYEIMEV
jgi:hypothetical protein